MKSGALVSSPNLYPPWSSTDVPVHSLNQPYKIKFYAFHALNTGQISNAECVLQYVVAYCSNYCVVTTSLRFSSFLQQCRAFNFGEYLSSRSLKYMKFIIFIISCTDFVAKSEQRCISGTTFRNLQQPDLFS